MSFSVGGELERARLNRPGTRKAMPQPHRIRRRGIPAAKTPLASHTLQRFVVFPTQIVPPRSPSNNKY